MTQIPQGLVETAAATVLGHDDLCESQFEPGPMAWSPCACGERAARAVLGAVLPSLRPAVDRDALAKALHSLSESDPLDPDGCSHCAHCINEADRILASSALRHAAVITVPP